ncbi:dihydrolipoamide acetyltransferase family protein [Georgenia yuyongxinii]|uniref:Dihydrolipoamide acetyltransferase component of pyruvate dehydrogenase complex n=1 Tax=Georgenia yuyongxinii TaxID=2589797 RepID=A0A552WVZ5_9MICO|nr:dihydrolipoamide acetyltransferase family protein [Georgenia yuyongxinii]TRW46942.1 2-oxo acid dehydrogenase subunit E2 [Georgenia yuyongxinii]
MPSYQQFRLPDVGEGLTEADIVTWQVAVGDAVTVNQTLCEIETAKSVVELPSPFAGVVHELLTPEGATVEVGTPIISIDVDPGGAAAVDDGGTSAAGESEGSGSVLVGYGTKASASGRRPRRAAAPTAAMPAGPADVAAPSTSATPAGSAATAAQAATAAAPAVAPEPATAGDPSGNFRQAAADESSPTLSTSAAPPRRSGRVLAKPPVRKLAKDLGLDLDAVAGTGPGGIITRDDVERYRDKSEPGSLATYAGDEEPWLAGGLVTPDGRRTRVPAKSVRKRTAEAMVHSAFTAPHVTVFHTIDVTRTMKLVERLKQDRDFADVRVTPLLITMRALISAVRRNPEVNASWEDETKEIVYKHYINLGIAAATPRGLVVPNIKDAHRLSLHELAVALGELTDTARAGRTQPADMADGTITITNVGVFGIDTGTPILNPGESAILAFGAIRQQPWVHKGKIKPRWVTQLALSVDHRLVDGGLAAKVLADVARVLEDPAQVLVWG